MNDVSNVAEAMQRTALGQYLGENVPGFTYTEPVSVDDMNFVTMMQVNDILPFPATLPSRSGVGYTV